MEEFLRSDLFRVAAALAVAAVVLRLLWRRLFPPKVDAMHLRVRCASCGWKGTVGKYNRRCSRCHSTALETLR